MGKDLIGKRPPVEEAGQGLSKDNRSFWYVDRLHSSDLFVFVCMCVCFLCVSERARGLCNVVMCLCFGTRILPLHGFTCLFTAVGSTRNKRLLKYGIMISSKEIVCVC